jgi:UDP-N-acetylmuramate dehydrogenase
MKPPIIIAKYVPRKYRDEDGGNRFLFAVRSDRIDTVKANHASIPRLFRQEVKRALRRSVSLRLYSNFKIGGRADFFFAARSTGDLQSSIRFAHSHGLPFYVIGSGTNILFDDEGFRGLIIKSEVQGIDRLKEGRVEALSGSVLSDLLDFAAAEGLRGLEFAAGIPGTVGGAIFGNAGAFGRCIGDVLEEAVLLDGQGREFLANKKYFEFGYRHSSLKKTHLTLLKAVFQLKKADKEKIKADIEKNLKKRKLRHPSSQTAYAGSYFKNPILADGTKVAAGYLLEKAGAKRLKVGDAAVFPRHANFIINLGRAKARDVLLLAQELKARIKTEFGVELEEEVIYLPANFSMP